MVCKCIEVVISDPKGVAMRWAHQYARNGDQVLQSGKTSTEILKALKALKRPTKQQVDKIIGNETWTSVLCSGCNTYVLEAVSFGEQAIYLCLSCLQSGVRALRKVKK